MPWMMQLHLSLVLRPVSFWTFAHFLVKCVPQLQICVRKQWSVAKILTNCLACDGM